MTKSLFILFFITGLNHLIACECEYPEPIMEFYTAEHVFEGKVISKNYAQDSLHFTVRLEVTKHYKVGDNPKYMDFTFPSEGKFTGMITSCDWTIKKDENWLIFTRFQGNRLTFGPMCSNSQFLKDGISKKMRDLLTQANSFNIQDYIYRPSREIYDSNNWNIKMDSIIKGIRKKLPEEPGMMQLFMLINEQGRLELVDAFFPPPPHIWQNIEYDPIFMLIKSYKPTERDSLKDIELNLIESIYSIKNWEIQTHQKTNVPIKYFLNPIVIYNEDIGEWEI